MTLADLLEAYPVGSHIIVVNEEGDTLLNDQLGWCEFNRRYPILKHACVLVAKKFSSAIIYNGISVEGIKVMVGHHES